MLLSAVMLDAMPLAAAGDWLQFLIPLVFFIIYAINHLLSGGKGKQPQAPPRNPPRRREAEQPLGDERQPAKSVKNQQGRLNDEIEQFLKRAEQRRAERARRGSGSTKPAEPLRAPEPPPPPRRIVEPEKPRELSTVASSVEQHLGKRGFEESTRHLADDIARADQQMEAHLQQAFSHRVGTLETATPVAQQPVTDAPTAAVVETSSTAQMVAGLLANPRQVKQAIILREILDRPEHRW